MASDTPAVGAVEREAEGFDFHRESEAGLSASPETAFAYLDDHAHLGTHMRRPSWMMAGARMDLELDSLQGRAVGSVMRMRGTVLGLRLFVESVVTERVPPERKTWRTLGAPQLLVIGPYRMGFEIAAAASGSRANFFIDYRLPERGAERVLGTLLGHSYARWCVERMAGDAARHFRQGAGSGSDARGVERGRGPR